MSLQSVRIFLAAHAPDLEILEVETSTATVALAAAAHGIEPDRIAKTLSRVYADVSLRRFDVVVPAVGSPQPRDAKCVVVRRSAPPAGSADTSAQRPGAASNRSRAGRPSVPDARALLRCKRP